MSLPESLTTEIQRLAPSAIIELFELDLTALGGDLLRFHAGTNNLAQNIVWNGNEYVRFPVAASGFEYSGSGQFPRPKIQVSNALSAISTLILLYGDLQGAKVTRRRTLAKFLDAVNFAGGVNASADPEAEFEADIYFVDRKSIEDRDHVEFELASACDLMGVQLPRRQVIQNLCAWKYRGAECGFTGAPMYDSLDNVIQLSPGLTSFGRAMIVAKLALDAATTSLASAQAALTLATAARGNSCQQVRLSTGVSITILDNSPFTPVLSAIQDCVITSAFTGQTIGYSGGSVVSLGSTYRVGDIYREIGPYKIYYIEIWGTNPACSAATTAYNSAVATRDAATTALAAAQANFDTALGALPDNDPLYAQDICGKRLNSCKLRFGTSSPLPFGSFPGAGLTQ